MLRVSRSEGRFVVRYSSLPRFLVGERLHPVEVWFLRAFEVRVVVE